MALAARLKSFLAVPKDNERLLLAQYHAFTRQVPLMYFVLLVNTWALVSTQAGRAPRWLAIYMPVLMTVVCAIRVYAWLRSYSHVPTPAEAHRALVRTVTMSGVLAVVFTTWALALFPYGDDFGKSHVAFYMAITVVGCFFCLLHLRPAAFAVALIANIAFVGFFALSGNGTLIAMSINVFLVTAIMLVILLVYYRDFERMVNGQTELQALSDENMRTANLDALTGLPNRRHFFSLLDTAFAKPPLERGRIALGVLDLDGFKLVNDLHGHLVGDKLIAAVGERLAQVSGGDLRFARIGGDEFAFFNENSGDLQMLLTDAEKLCASLKTPFHLAGITVRIGGSIGMAVYPELASKADELYERADYALYHGKRNRKGHVTLFNASHEAEIQRDSLIETSLHSAKLDKELSIQFQPIVDIGTGKTVACEALARWNSPELGMVAPDDFIAIAERAGLVGLLTRTLLSKALLAANQWPSDIRLSFNLSAHDINAPDGVAGIASVLMASGFDPSRLDFEITETAVIGNFNQAKAAMNRLKSLGCGISLDDFGTGFSSLSQLHALPLTKIKVDRSFVTSIQDRPASYKIVKSLLTLSQDMDIGCIVEGVETIEELNALRDMGARQVQGFYYSRPLSEKALTVYFETPPLQVTSGAARLA